MLPIALTAEWQRLFSFSLLKSEYIYHKCTLNQESVCHDHCDLFLFCSEIILSQIHADARFFVAWSLRPFCFRLHNLLLQIRAVTPCSSDCTSGSWKDFARGTQNQIATERIRFRLYVRTRSSQLFPFFRVLFQIVTASLCSLFYIHIQARKARACVRRKSEVKMSFSRLWNDELLRYLIQNTCTSPRWCRKYSIRSLE